MKILLAAPRGFCAGVVRALETLDEVLEREGAPVWVNHEIVHNPHVVDAYAARGVVFSDNLGAIPEGATLVISAHGAPPALYAEAKRRGLNLVDGTCPLVSKVHNEVRSQTGRQGRHVLLIGHRDHVEVRGSAGYAEGRCTVIADQAEARAFRPVAGESYACAMQTTLSVTETADILAILRAKIPQLVEPRESDICYATTNRQEAVSRIAGSCDAFLVVGGENSSNSRRLIELAQHQGCRRTWFVSRGSSIEPAEFEGVAVLGLASGASTPEPLVQEALTTLSRHFALTIEEISVATETQQYRLPRLRQLG